MCHFRFQKQRIILCHYYRIIAMLAESLLLLIKNLESFQSQIGTRLSENAFESERRPKSRKSRIETKTNLDHNPMNRRRRKQYLWLLHQKSLQTKR